jgi:hypothetical protein
MKMMNLFECSSITPSAKLLNLSKIIQMAASNRITKEAPKRKEVFHGAGTSTQTKT